MYCYMYFEMRARIHRLASIRRGGGAGVAGGGQHGRGLKRRFLLRRCAGRKLLGTSTCT